MLYLTIKALHVASVIAWMAGMVATSVLLAAGRGREEIVGPAADLRLQRGLRVTMSAGIGATWLLGAWLAVDGDWFQSPWLFVKLGIALVLSMLHGVLTANLKRLGRAEGYQVPAWMGYLVPGQIAAVALIAFLVIVKPF